MKKIFKFNTKIERLSHFTCPKEGEEVVVFQSPQYNDSYIVVGYEYNNYNWSGKQHFRKSHFVEPLNTKAIAEEHTEVIEILDVPVKEEELVT